jgi:hypothetical protein
MKECGRCKQMCEDSDFHKDMNREDRLSWFCKKCKSQYAKRYNIDNKTKILKQKSIYVYPDGSTKRHNLKKRHNITPEEYNTMLTNQNNKCAICDKPLDKPHVDHNHLTGKIRAVLCRYCNLGLGHFYDDPNLLTKAAQYLNVHNMTPTMTD